MHSVGLGSPKTEFGSAMDLRQDEQGFFIIFFVKSSNTAKNEEKPCSTCPKPIFCLIQGT